MVAALVELEDVVMLDPVDANHDKAEHVAEIRWPQAQQRGGQGARIPIFQGRHLDFQNEQRDRNRKNAIAERLDAMRRNFRFGFGCVRHISARRAFISSLTAASVVAAEIRCRVPSNIRWLESDSKLRGFLGRVRELSRFLHVERIKTADAVIADFPRLSKSLKCRELSPLAG